MRRSLVVGMCLGVAGPRGQAQTRELTIASFSDSLSRLVIGASNQDAVTIAGTQRLMSVEGRFSVADVRRWLDSREPDGPERVYANRGTARRGETLEETSARLLAISGASFMVGRRVVGDRVTFAAGLSDAVNGLVVVLPRARLRSVLDGLRRATTVADSMTARGGTQAARPIPNVVTPVGADLVYLTFQVETRATPYADNPRPRYPAMLRDARVEGEVLAQFVVDTAGHAEISTFKVLKETHALFTQAVRATLPTMRFYPAKLAGRKVKQLVQLPFPFTISP